MLSIHAMKAHSVSYFTELAKEDYFFQGGEPLGRWLGRGSESLGLHGSVEKETLHSLFDGFSPAGNKLVRNAGARNRQAGQDLTFSAPKYVSVLWSQSPTDLRHAVQQAHDRAVDRAVSFVEDEASFARRGKGGGELEQVGKLVVAAFQHGTSRALDPHLHTHALVLNLAQRHDGSWGTVESHPFYELKLVAGAVYQAELAHSMRELGFAVAALENGTFELKGMPETLISEMSTRRREIEEALVLKGYDSAKAAEFANLSTRDSKQHVARADQFPRWQAQGKKHDFSLSDVLQQQQETATDRRTLVEDVTAHLLKSDTTFNTADFAREVLRRAPDYGLSADEALALGRSEAANNETLTVLENGRLTTEAVLKREKNFQDLVARSRYVEVPRVTARRLEKAISQSEEALSRKKRWPVKFSPEQRKALEHVTRGKTGSISVVRGVAGAGKTAMLDAARRAFEGAGYTVLGATLSGKAARELEAGSGIQSTTIRSRLNALKPTFSLKMFRGKRFRSIYAMAKYAEHAMRPALWEGTKEHRGVLRSPKTTYRPAEADKTVLVIDEAAMASNADVTTLATFVSNHGGKVILVGDDHQLQAIGQGGAFTYAAKVLGAAELMEPLRQYAESDRLRPLSLRDGDGRANVEALRTAGALHFAETESELSKKLIADWAKDGNLVSPEASIIITATREEEHSLNHAAQAARRDVLSDHSIRVSDYDLHVGDRVRFRENDYQLDVRNADFGTITEVDPRKRTVTVELDAGPVVTVPTRDYDALALAYASTTHATQGATFENAYFVANHRMVSPELAYTAETRSRRTPRLYTTLDSEMLAEVFSKKEGKRLASDQAESVPREAKRRPRGKSAWEEREEALRDLERKQAMEL